MTTLSTPALPVVITSTGQVRRRIAANRTAIRIAIWSARLLAVGLCIWAGILGWNLRTSLWENSASVRFKGDIENGWNQGTHVVDDGRALANNTTDPLTFAEFFKGYRQRYAAVKASSDDERYSLDYTPARLFVMSLWVWHALHVHPEITYYTDASAQPLLNFNSGCEATIAVFMFLLVHYWARRERLDRFGRVGEMPWILGLIAALFIWFNPALLVDGHMWPQWDCWTLPGYVAAAWLASIGWWFTGGISLAIAAMFKGQVLMVAPVILLWPLFAGQWISAWRAVVGFAVGIAVMAGCWLVPNLDALLWIGSVILISVGGICVARRRGWRSRFAWPSWGIIPVAAVAARPLLGSRFSYAGAGLIGMVLMTPLIARWMSRWSCAIWVAAIAAYGVFVGAGAFGGTWWWLQVGFIFPTYHFDSMSRSCANLPQLLQQQFQFQLSDIVLNVPAIWHIPSFEMPLKYLLITIYSITLVLCAIGAATQARRNSAKVLVALAAPWILMFTILGQMHERYLLFGAAAGVMVVGTSLGMALLQWVVIALGTISICNAMFRRDPTFAPASSTIMRHMYPGTAWMLMLIALVYLFVAVWPGKPTVGRGAMK